MDRCILESLRNEMWRSLLVSYLFLCSFLFTLVQLGLQRFVNFYRMRSLLSDIRHRSVYTSFKSPPPSLSLPPPLPSGSLSHGEDVAVYVFDIDQPSLPTPFCSVLVSSSDFMALSTAFHSTNSSDNSLHSHSVLPICLFMKVSPSPDIILCGLTSTK